MGNRQNPNKPLTEAQMNLARNLAQLIGAKKYKPLEQVVVESGVKRTTINNMLSMRADPSVGNVDRVAKALDRNASALLASGHDDAELNELVSVWLAANETGKSLIKLAVRAAKGSSK